MCFEFKMHYAKSRCISIEYLVDDNCELKKISSTVGDERLAGLEARFIHK